jgi:predicted cupin superfamily sugar epimerase
MTQAPSGPALLCERAAELVATLRLQPHPEGGFYRELFRSSTSVQPSGSRPPRSALTSIDFLLARGQFSAWHRVASDEAWHLLEGGPLHLWLMPPGGERIDCVELGSVDGRRTPRHVVEAGWWQAAEPLGDFAYVGATVAPGFDFADFSFLREDAAAMFLSRIAPELARLL